MHGRSAETAATRAFMVLSAAEMRSVLLLAGTLAAVLVCPPPAAGQTLIDERLWTAIVLQERPGTESPWKWSFDALARSRNGVNDLDVMAFRPTIAFDLTSRSSVGGGYAWSPAFPTAGGVNHEHRLFQQYIWAGRAGASSVTLRTRLEQRFIEGNNGMLARLRQQARISRPLRSGSRISLVGYDEILFHLNDTSRSPRGVDQNRAFGGLGFAFTPAARVEAGYLNQFSPGHGGRSRMNHVLSTSATFAF